MIQDKVNLASERRYQKNEEIPSDLSTHHLTEKFLASVVQLTAGTDRLERLFRTVQSVFAVCLLKDQLAGISDKIIVLYN